MRYLSYSLLLLLPLAAAGAPGADASPTALPTLLAELAEQRPDVQWSKESLVQGDFNVDQVADHAIVGYMKNRVVVAVQVGSASAAPRPQYLEFGVGVSQQAAICAVPAKLYVDALYCSPQVDESLAGCRESKLAQALSLSDDECDSIHFYWNHETKRIEWWRL